ncbi:hypothetical protein ZIOFF_013769 [Zingiber officinale]|uniref:Retrotransposon gag domain-containing protein n=1 Tax=Zingiber officinale TaxID=94328 RepID=A0A8J5HZW5_ZINOF|nr:hypothetical protein ZIOFF_013769 [Zingiber officinale]
MRQVSNPSFYAFESVYAAVFRLFFYSFESIYAAVFFDFSSYAFELVYTAGMPPRRVYQRHREDGCDGGEREEERHATPDPPSPLPDAATRILEGMTRLSILVMPIGDDRRTCICSSGGWALRILLALLTPLLLRGGFDPWRLKRKFISLRQGDLSVAEFVKKFDRGCHFVPLITNDAIEKLRHFLDGLRPIIRRDVLLADPTEYQDAVTRAYRAERSLKDIEGDGHKDKEYPKLQESVIGRAFVMHAKEAEPDTTLVTSRISIVGVATYALLNSGATHSFISKVFVKRLGILPEDKGIGFKATGPSGE